MLLATPIAGSVGSSLGLKPYSSTSFLRSSSPSFRCFRLRQKKRAANTINATAATGTTTATAILPPGDIPPELADGFADGVARAAAFDEIDDEGWVAEDRGVDAVGRGAMDWVRVIKYVDGFGSLLEGVTRTSSSVDAGDSGIVAVGKGAEVLVGGVLGCGCDELDCCWINVEEGGELEGGVREGKENAVEVLVNPGTEITITYESSSH